MGSLFWLWSHLWLITSMKPQTCSFPFMAFLTDGMLAGNNHYTKVFLLSSLSWVMGSALVDTSGKAATSLRKMSSSFEAGSSCVLSQTHLHWEDLRAQFATLWPISNREARILLMQQLFQKQKMKGIVTGFLSVQSEETPQNSVDCKTAPLSLVVISFSFFF